MIKKIFKHLLTICVIGLGLINFSSASYKQTFEKGITASVLDQNNGIYNFTLENNGNFLTDGQYKYLTFTNTTNVKYIYNIFWTDNGLYLSLSRYQNLNSPNTQGYFKKFYQCNGDHTCSNGGVSNMSSSVFYDSAYSNPDRLYVYCDGQYMHFCFEYDNLNVSNCVDYNHAQINTYLDTANSLGITYNPTVPSEFNNNNNAFSQYVKNSLRGGSGGGGEGGGEEGGEEENGTRTNNNYYCPTLGQVMKNFGPNYNTGLCYNSTLKYDGNQITTVEKKDIFTVFTDYTEYTNRISIYRNNCNSTSTQSNCNSAFNNQREKYSIIANAINSNVDEKKLWNYCNIGLNYDLNATTCVAQQSGGYIAEPPTTEELINDIINGHYNNIEEILTPNSTSGTGNIFNVLINNYYGTGSNVEEGPLTRNDVATRDILGQLDQLKGKVGGIFYARTGKNGIIPDYILWLILTTLLLTVLLKK